MPPVTLESPARPVATPTDADTFRTDRVVTISFGHMIHDTYTAFVAPLLPKFIETMALTKTEAGALTIFSQLPSLFQPVIGHLSDRKDLRWLVIVAPALTAAAVSLMGITPTYFILAMLLLLAGVGSAGLHAIGPVIVGQQSGPHLGRGMSFWMVGGELGRTIGPIVVVTAVGVMGMRGLPWLMIFGLLTSALLYYRLKDIPAHFAVTGSVGPAIPVRMVLRSMAPFLLPMAGILVARAYVNASLTTYLPIFLTEEGSALWLAGASLSILEAAGVVGALTGGSISDRFGRKPVLAASVILTPLMMVVFLGVTGPMRLLLLLLMGFVGLSLTPVMMALVQESFPENRALANGVYMAMNFLIRSGVVLLLGMMSDAMGTRQAFLISAGIGLIALPFVWWLPVKNGPGT